MVGVRDRQDRLHGQFSVAERAWWRAIDLDPSRPRSPLGYPLMTYTRNRPQLPSVIGPAHDLHSRPYHGRYRARQEMRLGGNRGKPKKTALGPVNISQKK